MWWHHCFLMSCWLPKLLHTFIIILLFFAKNISSMKKQKQKKYDGSASPCFNLPRWLLVLWQTQARRVSCAKMLGIKDWSNISQNTAQVKNCYNSVRRIEANNSTEWRTMQHTDIFSLFFQVSLHKAPIENEAWLTKHHNVTVTMFHWPDKAKFACKVEITVWSCVQRNEKLSLCQRCHKSCALRMNWQALAACCSAKGQTMFSLWPWTITQWANQIQKRMRILSGKKRLSSAPRKLSWQKIPLRAFAS